MAINRQALAAGLLIFSEFLGASSLFAGSVSIKPVADTTLQEAFPNNNYGGGTTTTAGGRRQGGKTRSLYRFDVASNVPAGSTITSATLTLTVTSVPSGGVNSTFDLHRLLASWGEGNGSDHGGTLGTANQATWLNRLGSGTPWTTPGGDFTATASATKAVTGLGSYTFGSTSALVSDVQAWLNTPANNFGWLLRSESESTATTIRRFASRDDAVNSPMLTISFSLPGDFNQDGKVDAADYVVWRKGFGTTFSITDYNNWRANFGQTGGSGASFEAIPEPTQIGLLVSCAIAVIWQRRRISSCRRLST